MWGVGWSSFCVFVYVCVVYTANINYLKLFFTEFFLCLCQKCFGYYCVGLFINSVLFHWLMSLSLHKYPRALIIVLNTNSFLKKILFTYFEKVGKGRRRKGRETATCGCLSRTPHWGPGLQLRHVPWLGIEPATRWFPGCRSIHWATPARETLSLKIRQHDSSNSFVIFQNYLSYFCYL